MLSTFLILEGTAILLIVLMLKLPTTRGTYTELVHSQVFDKAVIALVFLPILFGVYYLYKSSSHKLFLVIDVILFIFVCALSWYDTVKVTEMHNKNIEKDKKKKKNVYVRPVSSKKENEKKIKSKEEAEKDIAERQKTRETSGEMSVEEVMDLLKSERNSNDIDWNRVAEEAALHANHTN